MVGASIVERLGAARLVPVVRTPDRVTAERACDWLAEAGCTALEITFSVPEAASVIETLRRWAPDLLIGAGTVLRPDQVKAAHDAGAEFLVSPCAVPGVLETARSLSMPFLQGAATPSEVFAAHEQGAPLVKVFPAATLGGAGYLKTLRSVFPGIALMPTGGIDTGDIAGYLAAGATCVGIGGSIAPVDRLERNDKSHVIETARAMLEQCGL